MTRLSFSPLAVKQIDLVYSYISRNNPAAAQRVVDRIGEVAEHVRANPGAGRATTIPGVSMFVVNPYPYLLFFRHFQDRNEVRVLRVFHAARRRPQLREAEREFRA